jgi:GntR family transcriptional regulator, transcriptional repressor for pyruvate dehydrogenase complex
MMGDRRRAADLAGIQPVSSRRVSEQVADQIRGLITRERLAEGDRLPPERDLAEGFGVSRPMVSQALRMLSLMGLVEIRQGSGAYVLRRPQHMVAASVSLMLDLDQGPLDDLAELRLWLETLGAVHAAERAEPAGLSGSLRRLAGATGSAAAWIAADTVFHADVVRAAGNAYLTALYEGVHTAVLSQEHELWVRTEAEPGWLAGPGRSVLLDIHQAIYDAVAAGDATAAQTAVLRHHKVMLEHLGR